MPIGIPFKVGSLFGCSNSEVLAHMGGVSLVHGRWCQLFGSGCREATGFGVGKPISHAIRDARRWFSRQLQELVQLTKDPLSKKSKNTWESFKRVDQKVITWDDD